MPDTLLRIALGLALRFNDTQPDIRLFVESLRSAQATDARSYLSSPETETLLAELDSTALILLAELLDEVRLQGESRRLYREAAFFDLVSDRVKDELISRKGH